MSSETDYQAGDHHQQQHPGGSTSSVPRPTLQQSHEGEHHGDFGTTDIPISKAVKIFAFCAAMNSCNLGYDIGVSTHAAQLVQTEWDLSDFQVEVFVGFLNLFSIFGALFSQYFSDTYGRRTTFMVAAVGFIIGLLIKTAALNYVMLMVGRALVGFGVGVGLAIDPVYISEMSPAKHRGELVTWSEIGINIGIVLGFAMGIVLGGLSESYQWRMMFLLGTILPCCMIYLALNVMAETPRWYVLKYRYDDAKGVLRDIYPPGYNVDLVVDDIKEALERERLAEKSLGWSAIFFPTAAFRRMLIVGCGIAFAQQAVGIDAIQYYLVDILQQTIDQKTVQNFILIILGLIKLFCIFIGGKLFDRRGRRPLVYVSLVGMAASLLLISVAFFISGNENPSTVFTVMGLALYLAFFSMGMGPAAWLIPSEIFATCIRAKAMSVAAIMNRIGATVMSSTFLSQKNALTWGGFFLMLSFICLLFLVFLYFLLPETKGRSLEDMSLYFAEITGDFTILEAERKIRVEEELQQVTKAPGTAGEGAQEPESEEGGTLT